MIYERISLDPGNENVFLDTYAIKDERVSPRDAMLVIPGGAYHGVCADREGECVSLAFVANGVNAFMLKYAVGEDVVFPTQLLNAAKAIVHIKENAEKYHINPNRIFVVGFSAGGHLTGTVLTLHKLAEKELGLEENYLKPRGAIFSYPVITAYGHTHEGSFRNLLKKPLSEYTEDEKKLLSIEKNITAETSPAFIWHSSEDMGVPIDGSLKLAQAYYDVGTPVELHIYPYGPHGMALAKEHTSSTNPNMIQPKAEKWLDEALKWMQGLDK